MFWLLKVQNYTNFGDTPTEAFNNMQQDIGSEYQIESCEFYKVESKPIKMKQEIIPVPIMQVVMQNSITPDSDVWSPYKDR